MGILYIIVFGRVAYNTPLYNIPILIAAFVIISLINAGGCAINDYFDHKLATLRETLEQLVRDPGDEVAPVIPHVRPGLVTRPIDAPSTLTKP